MIIDFDGIPIELVKKAVKNVNLRIYPPDGLVKISVPKNYPERLIQQFLQEKSDWIHKQRNRIKTRTIPAESQLETGSSIRFKGKNYLLIVKEHHGPTHIELAGELIYCYIKPDTNKEHKEILFERWYRREMELIIPELITFWEQKIQVHVAQWGIKKMKTRWGSCNTRAKRIWLNLNLIKKPLICLEYVLVHELVHLLEASHNHRFYALMTQFMPQWREYQFLLEGK